MCHSLWPLSTHSFTHYLFCGPGRCVCVRALFFRLFDVIHTNIKPERKNVTLTSLFFFFNYAELHPQICHTISWMMHVRGLIYATKNQQVETRNECVKCLPLHIDKTKTNG